MSSAQYCTVPAKIDALYLLPNVLANERRDAVGCPGVFALARREMMVYLTSGKDQSIVLF